MTHLDTFSGALADLPRGKRTTHAYRFNLTAKGREAMGEKT